MAANAKSARPQVNVRVPPHVMDVLDAAAFVREYRGLQELVAPELERFANRLRREPAVGAALAARETRRRDAG
jgi:hypothetical protein